MSLNIKRIQVIENGVAQDVDILTSADSVTFEDGVNLQDKYDNGDIASADVLGDITDVVGTLNELGASAKENTELISELANRGGLTSALRKEVCDGEWKSVSTLPYSFQGGCAVVYNDELHILGGQVDATAHYKWNGFSWESVSISPWSIGNSSCAVVYNNEIHTLGYTQNHYKYNGEIWESVSTLPYTFYYGSAVVFNDEIHILGSNNSSYRTKHYKWNGTTWESVSTLPYEFYSGSAVVLNNKIHMLGGALQSNNIPYKHYEYTGSYWTSISTIPFMFYEGDAVVLDNTIHIFDTASEGNLHYKWNGTSWSNVSTLPAFFKYSCVVVFNKHIHIIGTGGGYNEHYNFKLGTYLNGYSKADTEIYLPISTTPITSNLVATDDGYTVTEDGYVEVLLNE